MSGITKKRRSASELRTPGGRDRSGDRIHQTYHLVSWPGQRSRIKSRSNKNDNDCVLAAVNSIKRFIMLGYRSSMFRYLLVVTQPFALLLYISIIFIQHII